MLTPLPLWLAALVLLLPTIVAQQPAPFAETDAAIWSAEEGSALFFMRANLRHIRENTSKPAQIGGRAVEIGGYSLGFFVQGEAGDAQMAESIASDQKAFILAWPRAVAAETRRGILVHSDGTTLFCELSGEELPELSAEIALARGGTGKFHDALRQPGAGGKGHIWLWLSQTGVQKSVQVVDSEGNPRPDVVVAVVGDGKAQRSGPLAVRLPKSLPLAEAKTNERGIAWLKGPRCVATIAFLHASTRNVVGSRVTVEDTPAGLRFVVPENALVNPAMIANESAAIATLKNISSAQAQCQACAVIDTNANGAGEYGFFGELSGALALRKDDKGGVGEKKIQPPVLSAAFQKVANGRVVRSGYVFQMFLPDSKGNATAEAATGGSASIAIDSGGAEVMWCCYAWPASPKSGLRAFFVNQAGDVIACDNDGDRYCGNDKPPAPTAAYAAGTAGTMQSDVAANMAGIDGQRWVIVF